MKSDFKTFSSVSDTNKIKHFKTAVPYFL